MDWCHCANSGVIQGKVGKESTLQRKEYEFNFRPAELQFPWDIQSQKLKIRREVHIRDVKL